MSCATHRLDGGMELTVTLMDAEGSVIETLRGSGEKEGC
jgi:hypothetical protein